MLSLGKAMLSITFINRNGVIQHVKAETGSTLMEVARDNHVVGIDGDCGGACVCATCHVYVHKDWTNKLAPMTPMENDMLEFAHGRKPPSRLSCQILLNPELDGLIITIPPADTDP